MDKQHTESQQDPANNMGGVVMAAHNPRQKPSSRAVATKARNLLADFVTNVSFAVCLQCLRYAPLYTQKLQMIKGFVPVDQKTLETGDVEILVFADKPLTWKEKQVKPNFRCEGCGDNVQAALTLVEKKGVRFYKLEFATKVQLPELLGKLLSARIRKEFIEREYERTVRKSKGFSLFGKKRKNQNERVEGLFGGTIYQGCIVRNGFTLVLADNWPGIWPKPWDGSMEVVVDYAMACASVLSIEVPPKAHTAVGWQGEVTELPTAQSLLDILTSAERGLHNLAVELLERDENVAEDVKVPAGRLIGQMA